MMRRKVCKQSTSSPNSCFLGKKDEGVEEANHHLGILPTISRPYPSARHHSSRMIIRF